MLLIQEDLECYLSSDVSSLDLTYLQWPRNIRVLLTSSEAPLVINICEINSQLSRLLALFLNAEPASYRDL